MVSRLDRLFILLDTGSNESVRLAAAKQLGEVQRVQPNDLNYLLRRIKEYSGKSVWETRVAAGHATRCVLEQVRPWPESTEAPLQDDTKLACKQSIIDKLIVENVNTEQIIEEFDLDKIMFLCPTLLSTNITENDDTEIVSSSSSREPTRGRGRGRKESTSRSRKNEKESLLRQRKLINKELGISLVDSLGVNSTDIVTNDDLKADYSSDITIPSTSQPLSCVQQGVCFTLQNSISNYTRIVELLRQVTDTITTDDIQKDSDDGSPNDNWPLLAITKEYIEDLFNASWEIRHGSAIALREIVKLHGKSAGKLSNLSSFSNDKLNQLWLFDMALRALCILVLDKFGDFLFDQVVAPVRENAAQLLGCCVASMSESNASLIIKLLLKLLSNQNWETRHGGILGLKYSLHVINEAFVKRTLEDSFDSIFKCLADNVDDVSAEAAAALVPVKDLMIETIPDKTPKLIKFLWEHLADLDELTTSTSNIILLLASLITSSSAQLEPAELTKSIPKLWPLLSHSSTSVRISVLKALLTLIKPQTTSSLNWMSEELFTTALRLVFQRAILENMEEVHPYIESVWVELLRIDEDKTLAQSERLSLLKSTSQFLNYWLCLTMQPANTLIDRGYSLWLNINSDGTKSETKPDGEIYIGSCTFNAETINQQKTQITKCRVLGTKLIGLLYAKLVYENDESHHGEQTLKYLSEMFIHYIKTKSANQRIISGWALESWASCQIQLFKLDYGRLKTFLPSELTGNLSSAIQDTTLCYDELASSFTRLQQETREYVSAIIEAQINPGFQVTNDKRAIYNVSQMHSLCKLNLEAELSRIDSKKQGLSTNKPANHDVRNSAAFISLSSKKSNLAKSLETTLSSQKNYSISVLSSLACAHIAWRLMPDKLKLVSEPLLDSIEVEDEPNLQTKSINYLITMLDILCSEPDLHSSLIGEILKRLIDILYTRTTSLMVEYDECSIANNTIQGSTDVDKRSETDKFKIVLLDNLQRKAELSRSASRRQSSVNSTSNLKRSHSLTSNELDKEPPNSNEDSSRSDPSTDTKLRGVSCALSKIVHHFGEDLPKKLPTLWASITTDIESLIKVFTNTFSKGSSSIDDSKLIKNLLLLQTVGKSLHEKLRTHLEDLFNHLVHLLSSSNPMIRHQSSQCIGFISKLIFKMTEEIITERILPLLEHEDTITRCGSIEAIALMIEHIRLDLVPKINMFVVHVLRRMSDQNDQVRLMATHCFGGLLSLMPLNLEKREGSFQTSHSSEDPDEQSFIEQLLDPKKLKNYNVPFEMSADLRSYQQDGLNWLAFLNRFNLHGILCDEMGLGKTLMTICMVASDHHTAKTISTCGHAAKRFSSPSLIVCPTTLTEHWLYEIEKFMPRETRSILNPIAYAGALNDRMSLRCRISNSFNVDKKESNDKHPPINLVVSSYDIVRNDIDFFKGIHWNYCVLDEGHIIKNGKTKLSKAIRLLNAKHRLILSGTPIQNNVTELWSLFDFLMPGFLGSERQFNARYAKPILQSREPKCSPRELEAGALAMESLHRQVLPFILRRLKEDVLDDLPPKIIQDYYCELSALQLKLYDDFTRSKLCKDVTKRSLHQLDAEGSQSDKIATSKSHVFQALQYLKNVCNHPKLVLTEKHSQYKEIMKNLDNEKSSLDDITHSSKLKALKQLLIDCGIGIASQPGEDNQQQATLALESVVNQHRALVFCQLRSMVNIIENDLIKKHLPSITYLKLDGSIPTNQRQQIVSRFNNDPSIDILLLTTQIGGLGLNLTGADTVIFVEHDWNPTKDLQAMDRAHRIGQKKVVNVYRLITKATLEEKIMGLQKFKTMVSNTVINQDNSGLGTMNVDQLFDLFEEVGNCVDSNVADNQNTSGTGKKSKSTSFVDLLPELWDQQQYETEYDLSNFVSSLKN